MVTKIDKKYTPDKEYPYFYYDVEGDGFAYFKSEELRDKLANEAIQNYLDDGWDEQVENVIVGTLTGKAAMVDVVVPIGEIDEDEGTDEAGEYWDGDFEYRCNYEIKPISFICPSISKLKSI